uniref:Uncharacterized protein n=1 Tax=Setaria digitata TaxID=48799 RepID=A0A915PD53_9BILA
MLEYHQKDTVDSVACGKEQYVTVEDVYEMSQSKNGQYRWKRAFQFPPLLQTFPVRLRHQEISETKFSARMKMDCAETAAKLRTYVQECIKTFEGTVTVGNKFSKRVFTASTTDVQKQLFATTGSQNQSILPCVSNDSALAIEDRDSDVNAYVTAKRLVGKIRAFKEEIVGEMKIWQETNAENRQLGADIRHFRKKLKELNTVCANCELHNVEIEQRKKRYSEQLKKISKLISEQMERAEEEKYRNVTEKLVANRIELRKELYAEMDNYESLRAQIKQTEMSLVYLQKTIDVYDAEFWQLDDRRHDLQSQIFQLQELLRHSKCRHYLNLCDDNGDKSENRDNVSDKVPNRWT